MHATETLADGAGSPALDPLTAAQAELAALPTVALTDLPAAYERLHQAVVAALATTEAPTASGQAR